MGNRETKTKYLMEQRNINHYRDQKAENKFESNFGKREHIFKGKREHGLPYSPKGP